jgi:hypothetical protein
MVGAPVIALAAGVASLQATQQMASAFLRYLLSPKVRRTHRSSGWVLAAAFVIGLHRGAQRECRSLSGLSAGHQRRRRHPHNAGADSGGTGT